MDGWKSRSGFSSALIRERVTDKQGKQNSYLKIVNSYPKGDLSASIPLGNIDFQATPQLNLDYSFDVGARVNLYFSCDKQWYELLLTDDYAMANVFTLSKGDNTRFMNIIADGGWHHLQVDIASLITEAIKTRTGVAPHRSENR